MTSFLVAAATTQTSRISMSGTDDLTVQATGALSVSANAQSVRFNGATTNGLISNSGTIENTASGGRAIRFETSVGASFTATINNLAGGIVRSDDDAIQIQAGSVTAGSLQLTNTGSISSNVGQALDLAGGTTAFVATVTNNAAGTISGLANDGVRFGATGNLDNFGSIEGGSSAGFTLGADGVQYEDGATGTLTNRSGATISGDRHGVNGGIGTDIDVTNELTGQLIGRNGSGVGLDGNGSVTNYGLIQGNFSNSPGSDENSLGAGGTPDGTPDGDGDGVDIDGEATIENYGTIEGTGAGGHGSDGRANTSEAIAAGGGTITNHSGGTITGLGLGILIDDSSTGNAPFATTIVNDGTISGTNSIGIRIISIQDDVIENNGIITAGAGAAAIEFGEGDGTLRIGNGSSITGLSDGQGGTDLLDYSSFTASGVRASLTDGGATGTDGIANFENITGSALADRLLGNAGGNVLKGSGGEDRLDGLGGDDTMAGGSGIDRYQVDSTADVVDETDGLGGDAGGTDRVTSTATYSLTGLAAFVENLVLSGSADIDGTGNGLANRLTGNTGANVLAGDAGDDIIAGAAGGDELLGGADSDRLDGGIGADTIDGGAGDDRLFGGADADTFRFERVGAGRDVIYDFNAAEDQFDLSGGAFTARSHRNGDTILTHDGGTIVVKGVVGLTLAAWNALVASSGARAAADGEAVWASAPMTGDLAAWHDTVMHTSPMHDYLVV